MSPATAPEKCPSHEIFSRMLLLSSGGRIPMKSPPYKNRTTVLIMAERQLRKNTDAKIRNVTSPKMTMLAPM